MGLNVFKDYRGYSRHWMLTHPWLYFKHGYYNLKAAWQRATRGYANRDTWDMDTWFLQVFPAMLKQLSQNANGHPCSFKSYEEWTEFLYQLAIDFEKCQDDEGNDENEYYDDYMKSLDDIKWKRDENGCLTWDTHEHHDEISKLYFDRMKETSKERQKLLEDCFARLGKWIRTMWD